MTKRSIEQDIILNVYVTNNIVLKYVRQNLAKLKVEAQNTQLFWTFRNKFCNYLYKMTKKSLKVQI